MAGKNGKSGTITPDEFERLTNLVTTYGPLVVGQKVSKICERMSSGYLHEYPSSVVGNSWKSLATRISTAVGNVNRAMTTDNFKFLSDLVTEYGPEVIIQKVSKIASRTGQPNTQAVAPLRALFPKTNLAA